MDKDETITAENDVLSEQEDDVQESNDLEGAADLIFAADLNEQEDDVIEDGSADDVVPDEEYEPEDIPDEEPLPDDEPMPDEDEFDETAETVGTKRRPRLFRPILFVIIVCFCIIAAADMISQQNEIEQLEQETVMMNNKIEETKQKNDEYTALLEADEDDFMERVAVEQLGYSYPNERRYYIVNKSADK